MKKFTRLFFFLILAAGPLISGAQVPEPNAFKTHEKPHFSIAIPENYRLDAMDESETSGYYAIITSERRELMEIHTKMITQDAGTMHAETLKNSAIDITESQSGKNSFTIRGIFRKTGALIYHHCMTGEKYTVEIMATFHAEQSEQVEPLLQKIAATLVVR